MKKVTVSFILIFFMVVPEVSYSNDQPVFRIQVLSVPSEEKAKKRINEIDSNYEVQLEKTSIDNETWYRVSLGKFESQKEALNAAEKLQKAGKINDYWISRIPEESNESDPSANKTDYADTGPRISGFSSVDWGSDTKAAVEELGEPMRVNEKRGKVGLFYEVNLLSEDGYQSYWFDKQKGLFTGQYFFKVEAHEDCERKYNKFYKSLKKKYGHLEFDSNKENTTRSLDFCDALRIGDAIWYTKITDEKTGGEIEITIKADPESVMLRYKSPFFDDLKKQMRGEEINEKL